MLRDYANVNQDTLHVYADSTRPDDAGDGLTLATAKKTIEAAVALLPNIAEGHVVLHLTGTFTLTENVTISTNMQRNKKLIVDGGDSVEVLEGPYSATSGTTSTLTDSARSWTPNEWQGYVVEILDTSNIGHRTTIQSNTADTLTVVQNWSSAITTNSYRIVRPATVITASIGLAWFYYSGISQHDVCFQRLRFSGNVLPGLANAAQCNLLRITDVVYDGAWYFGAFNGGLYLSRTVYDPAAPDSAFSNTLNKAGVGYLGSNSKAVSLTGIASAFITHSALKADVSMLSTVLSIFNGCWIKKVNIRGYSDVTLVQSANCRPIIINGSADVGLNIEQSKCTISGGAAEISNSTTHAIELNGAELNMIDGGISGSSNGGLGLYAHDRSLVKLARAAPPTVTGSDGDVAVNDPTLPDTWANVISAGGLSSASEATIIKVS